MPFCYTYCTGKLVDSVILTFEEREQSMYEKLCSLDNLELAFKKARKRKTLKWYVMEFEKNLNDNLKQLQEELLSFSYMPLPLKTFIINDPKTRKISKSNFRDRVMHHALCNIIEPIFQKSFIHDSFANQINKGTLKAIERFDYFKRKVSLNNTKTCYLLKSDIKQYFETVDHEVMFSILKRKIIDGRVMWLIRKILDNYSAKEEGKGMPLGNLTSQFFANVYLNELDRFVKHQLKAKYYIRYVDDFVIFHRSKQALEYYKIKINQFLEEHLDIGLHPSKTKILTLQNGVDFLGMRIFFFHKLVRKKNLKKFERKFNELKELCKSGLISRDKAVEKFEGWLAYVSHANTYKYRRYLSRTFNKSFPIERNVTVENLKRHQNFTKRVEESKFEYSPLKTLHLFKKDFTFNRIAQHRNIKEATIWEHFAKLIEHNQFSIWKLLPKEKILKILPAIYDQNNKLKEIKERLKDNSITFDEINCVLAFVKSKNKEKRIIYHVRWYKRVNCYRKCFFNPAQRKECGRKFDLFVSQNPSMEMKRKEFLDIFNNHMNICVLSEEQKRKFVSWKEFKVKYTRFRMTI